MDSQISLNEIPKIYQSYVAKLLSALEKHVSAHPNGYQWTLNDFDIGQLLGKGTFGSVYLVREKQTKYMLALKVLNKSHFVRHNMEHQAVAEIEILSHLSHPHIIQFFTYFYNEKHIFLVLEFAAGGDLYSEMMRQRNKRFTEHLSAKYIYQIADALEYCHKNNVIHRDIKPENLLLTLDGNVKLGDFGWSTRASSSVLNKVCGTIDYIPPEMINGIEHSTYVDNWSLGVLCYEFLVGYPPFHSNSEKETFNKILNMKIVWPSHIKSDAKDLISKLLKQEGFQRISLIEVQNHSWILKHKDKND